MWQYDSVQFEINARVFVASRKPNGISFISQIGEENVNASLLEALKAVYESNNKPPVDKNPWEEYIQELKKSANVNRYVKFYLFLHFRLNVRHKSKYKNVNT